MIPIYFQVTCSKVKVKLPFWAQCVVQFIHLIPWLLALYRFCIYREDKPEFCTMGGIYVSETFLVFNLVSTKECFVTLVCYFLFVNNKFSFVISTQSQVMKKSTWQFHWYVHQKFTWSFFSEDENFCLGSIYLGRDVFVWSGYVA